MHNLHMNISYIHDHPVYKYIEFSSNNSKSFIFDRKYIISMNRFCRYDMSIPLLKRMIFPTKEYFLTQFRYSVSNIDVLSFFTSAVESSITANPVIFDTRDNPDNQKFSGSVNNCFDNDLIKLSNLLDKKTEHQVKELIKEYELYVHSHSQDIDFVGIICMWVYDKYEILRTLYMYDVNVNLNDCPKTKEYIVSDLNIEFAGMSLFLGTLEWFHILVIRMMVDELKSGPDNGDKCALILGEETIIEHEYMSSYSMSEIREFFSSEYKSHATVYLIDNHHISIFDPDADDVKYNDDSDDKIPDALIDKLCLFLKKGYVPIDLYPSIQTLTNDQYCIFHCINFILQIIEMVDVYSIEKLMKFMKYVDDTNKITKLSDVHTFAKTIDLKAKFFIN